MATTSDRCLPKNIQFPLTRVIHDQTVEVTQPQETLYILTADAQHADVNRTSSTMMQPPPFIRRLSSVEQMLARNRSSIGSNPASWASSEKFEVSVIWFRA